MINKVSLNESPPIKKWPKRPPKCLFPGPFFINLNKSFNKSKRNFLKWQPCVECQIEKERADWSVTQVVDINFSQDQTRKWRTSARTHARAHEEQIETASKLSQKVELLPFPIPLSSSSSLFLSLSLTHTHLYNRITSHSKRS